ncbi:MAG TPA: hypothetical protein VHL54_12505 [Actinomycetota bacterium]|nr:hypothetical protein [Actinomycetota bacterium]
MEGAGPVRIPCSAGPADAVNRAFLSWFWGFGALFAVAAFWRPALIPFTVGFPIYVVAWRRRVRRTPRAGCVLVVSRDRLALEGGRRTRSISRTSAGAVSFHRRGSGGGSWTELRVVDDGGKTVFREAVGEPELARITESLRSRGWPVDAPRSGLPPAPWRPAGRRRSRPAR